MARSLMTRRLSCTLLCNEEDRIYVNMLQGDTNIYIYIWRTATFHTTDLSEVVHKDGILHAMLS